MRFTSREATITYTVRRADYRVEGGIKSLVHGLRADFRNHNFDSEYSQKQLHWSDDDRKAVEEYLLAHPAFGKRLWVAEGGNKRRAGRKAKGDDEGKALVLRCVATVAVDGEAQLCGRPVSGDTDLCGEHLKLAESVSAEA